MDLTPSTHVCGFIGAPVDFLAVSLAALTLFYPFPTSSLTQMAFQQFQKNISSSPAS